MFKAHGEFCASHPWEVIVTTLMLTVCLLSIDAGGSPPSLPVTSPQEDEEALDVALMTGVRVVAVLYSFQRFSSIHKLGSGYLLGAAGLFTVFSSFVFSTSVVNFLRGNVADLKDALFFFLLLSDLPKTALLARFALSASDRQEAKANIAYGLSLLGPVLTLDTLVETLVVTVGTMSGSRRLEVLCRFACLSLIINYIVFMTFYPACLSLVSELSRSGKDPESVGSNKSCLEFPQLDEKPNPVLQRVKMVMSAALVIVHVYSHWVLRSEDKAISSLMHNGQYNGTENSTLTGVLMKWINLSVDHIVVLIVISALALKLVFFDNRDDLITSGVAGEIRRSEKAVQTEEIMPTESVKESRSLEKCLEIYERDGNVEGLNDDEVENLVKNGYVLAHQLETLVSDPERGVQIRRLIFSKSDSKLSGALANLPYKNYDYGKVIGACCENVIGFTQLPLGVAGPLLVDGRVYHVPMATTEGCLVASTSRGCKALVGTGVTSRLVADGMTRGPVVRFGSIARATQAMSWIESQDNFDVIRQSFDSTSAYARLVKLRVRIAGRQLFVRFVATTGDAMGMNMVSKGTEAALVTIKEKFPDMEILSLSGNYCTDKKPAAVNWLEGRGKSVVCEAVIPSSVVRSVLKTSVTALVDLNQAKNLIGSSISGSIGGFNAHAANIVTAIYLATGQDPAQNVVSSNCMTLMEPWGDGGRDLYITCTMPSLEVGTVGGGTRLPAQNACLRMLGVQGPDRIRPGNNANRLARIVCAAVLAGELSLMAALASGHLVKSHLKYNRSSTVVK